MLKPDIVPAPLPLRFDDAIRRVTAIPPTRARAIVEVAGGKPRKAVTKRAHVAKR